MGGVPDVAIVGGGVIGCVIALRLAQAGAAVTLVERGALGREASWASAGLISPPKPGLPGGLARAQLEARSFTLYPALLQGLAAALARRRQVVGMLTAEQKRLHIAAHIAGLAATSAADPSWRERDRLLRSVPGVGPVLATTLLAGVAPLNRDSGTLRGKRTVWGGRARVRGALYMATLVTTRHKPAIRAFYGRRCAAGKPKKVALTACMRKLLTILNTMLHHRTPWQDRLVLAA